MLATMWNYLPTLCRPIATIPVSYTHLYVYKRQDIDQTGSLLQHLDRVRKYGRVAVPTFANIQLCTKLRQEKSEKQRQKLS